MMVAANHTCPSLTRVDLPLEIIIVILPFCIPSALATLARVSHIFQSLAIPVLYRDLDIDLSLPNPLLLNDADPSNRHPHIYLAQSLRVSSQNHTGPSALSTTSRKLVENLPNLQSLHIHLDRQTCDWHHSSNLARSLLAPNLPELMISAEPGGDVLFWVLAGRVMDSLPPSITRLILEIGDITFDGNTEIRLWDTMCQRRNRNPSRQSVQLTLRYTAARSLSGVEGKAQVGRIAALALWYIKSPRRLVVEGWTEEVDGVERGDALESFLEEIREVISRVADENQLGKSEVNEAMERLVAI